MTADMAACRLVAPEDAVCGSGFGVSVGLWVAPRIDRAGAARVMLARRGRWRRLRA